MKNDLDIYLYNSWIKWFFDVNNKDSVLDAGCGIAKFHEFLISHNYKNVLGIDINENYIKIAKEKYPYDYIVYDISQEKFDIKDKFDVIISMDVLEHVKNPYQYIKNICSLAMDKIYLSTPNALRIELESYLPQHRYEPINDTAYQYFSPAVIKKIFIRFGFSCIYQNKKSRIGLGHIFLKFKKIV